jgi:Beta propeller domain
VTEDSGDSGESESAVVVIDAATVEEVGRVGGLGVTETIRSVRFIGDLGVVVTFRQTDPLYTLDLSDPADPQLVGELKVPGYSAYLHPVGDGRLLGVGQDATEEGMVTGVQASLFDVSDPAAPTRIDQVTFGQGSAGVESDPRAFLYWPDRQLAVLPLQTWSPGIPIEPGAGDDAVGSGSSSSPGLIAPTESFYGAVGVRVEGEGLAEAGRVSNPAASARGGFPGEGDPVQRAFVAGDVLYTVGYSSLAAANLDDLSPLGSVQFDN